MDFPAMYSLAGRHALACGSTQGIGYACAIQFARLGAEVTLVARREDALREAVGTLPSDSKCCHHFICADFDEPDDLAAEIRKFCQTLVSITTDQPNTLRWIKGKKLTNPH